jgi:predicted DNA-binding protein (UPF0251 family)
MPGKRKRRHCRQFNGGRNFKPSGIPSYNLEKAVLQLDELESMRLCDWDGKSQIEAAEAMGISRGTVQRLLISGRRKIMDVLLHTKELRISETAEETTPAGSETGEIIDSAEK